MHLNSSLLWVGVSTGIPMSLIEVVTGIAGFTAVPALSTVEYELVSPVRYDSYYF